MVTSDSRVGADNKIKGSNTATGKGEKAFKNWGAATAER